ncbi:MAG: oligosaccharide flippase family protein [Bacteroidetes bacterium]|nr:oligosaccharide flippase family protein [Bacteroidota bacterium]
MIYTLAGTLAPASGLILLPYYLGYLSPSQYGAFALYTGFSLLVQVIVTYSFDASVYNYYHEYKHDKERLGVFVSSAFNFILLVSVVLASLLLLCGDWLFQLVYSESKIEFFPYGVISVFTGVMQALFKVNNSLLQTQEKAPTFFGANLLSFSLIAGLTIAGLVLFPNDLIGPIGGRFLAVALSGLWVLGTVYRQFGFHFNFTLIKSTFGFNHPSLIYQIMQWFNNSFDRVILSGFMPLAQVGIYDLAAKCLMAIEFVLSGFYNSFFPKILGIISLQNEKKTTQEINRYFNGLTAVTILLVCLAILFFPIIRWFNLKQGFLSAIEWVPYIAVTYLLRSLRFYMAMPYASIKYSKPLPFIYAIIVTIKIASMALLIPRFGIMGLIISTWIGYLVELTTLFLGVRKKFEIKFNGIKLIVVPLVLGLTIIIFEPLFGKEFELPTHLFYVLLAGALLVFAYRNELKTLQVKNIIKK